MGNNSSNNGTESEKDTRNYRTRLSTEPIKNTITPDPVLIQNRNQYRSNYREWREGKPQLTPPTEDLLSPSAIVGKTIEVGKDGVKSAPVTFYPKHNKKEKTTTSKETKEINESGIDYLPPMIEGDTMDRSLSRRGVLEEDLCK